MRERGKYQIQCMKSRSSTGVGMKIDLDYNVETMRITDPGEEAGPRGCTQGRCHIPRTKCDAHFCEPVYLRGLNRTVRQTADVSVPEIVCNHDDDIWSDGLGVSRKDCGNGGHEQEEALFHVILVSGEVWEGGLFLNFSSGDRPHTDV